jgi:hypothetical protein
MPAGYNYKENSVDNGLLHKRGVVLNLISVGFLGVWFFLAFMTIFMFDAPGSTKNVFLLTIAFTVWSYPGFVLLALIGRFVCAKLQKESAAFIFSLLPILCAAFIMLLFGIAFIQGVISAQKTLKDAFLCKSGCVKMFTCSDGNVLKLHNNGQISLVKHWGSGGYSTSLVAEIKKQGFKEEIDLYPSSKSKVDYFNSCKDQNNNTIFDR